MSDLSAKLRAWLVKPPGRPTFSGLPMPEMFRSPLAAAAGGRVVTTPCGPCVEFTQDMSVLASDGPGLVTGFDRDKLRQAWQLIFGQDLPGSDGLRDVVFLDTETTGLGGAGAVVFLVGLGRIDGRGHFVIRQFFLEDYQYEPALLEALAEELAGACAVCTYNGRAFDAPIIENRFVLNRRQNPLAGLVHFDLVYPARRLYRRQTQDCSLSTLENQVLGIARDADVPGNIVPLLYQDYLASRNPGPMAAVLAHNRQDVYSLFLLARQLVHEVTSPLESRHKSHRLDLGALLERRQRLAEAAAVYELGLAEKTKGSEDFALTKERLSLLYKRLGQLDKAAAMWEEEVGQKSARYLPYIELAKYLEHVRRSPSLALEVVATARAHCMHDRWPAWVQADLERRYQRLARRMNSPPSP